jgi:hypothetical protein
MIQDIGKRNIYMKTRPSGAAYLAAAISSLVGLAATMI